MKSIVLLYNDSEKDRAAASLFNPTQVLTYVSREKFNDHGETRLIVLDTRKETPFSRTLGPEYFADYLLDMNLAKNITQIDLLMSDIPDEFNLLGFGDRFCAYYKTKTHTELTMRVISHPRSDSTWLVVPEKPLTQLWEIKGVIEGKGLFPDQVTLWSGKPTDASFETWLAEPVRSRKCPRLILSSAAGIGIS